MLTYNIQKHPQGPDGKQPLYIVLSVTSVPIQRDKKEARTL